MREPPFGSQPWLIGAAIPVRPCTHSTPVFPAEAAAKDGGRRSRQKPPLLPASWAVPRLVGFVPSPHVDSSAEGETCSAGSASKAPWPYPSLSAKPPSERPFSPPRGTLLDSSVCRLCHVTRQPVGCQFPATHLSIGNIFPFKLLKIMYLQGEIVRCRTC